jgi:hypothetical protein
MVTATRVAQYLTIFTRVRFLVSSAYLQMAETGTPRQNQAT